MPNIGWTSSTFPTKLGGADSRPMGTPNHGWIPTRTNNNPLPGPYVSHQIRFSPENKVQITTEVQELLDKGAILRDTTNTTELCVSNFSDTKMSGGQRPVINLKGPNQFLKTEHFKMEDLHLLPDRHGAITQCNGQSLFLTPYISITMYWTDFYQIYIFYALHIHDFTYQI